MGRGTVRKGACCRSFRRGRRTLTLTHTQAKRSRRPQEVRAQAEAARASGTSVLTRVTSDTKGGSQPTWWSLEPLCGRGHTLRRAGWRRMTWSDSITDSVDVNLSKLWETVDSGEGMLQFMGQTEQLNRNSSTQMGTLQNEEPVNT